MGDIAEKKRRLNEGFISVRKTRFLTMLQFTSLLKT